MQILDYEGKPIRKSLYKVFGTCPFCGGDIIASLKHIPYTIIHIYMVNKIAWKYFHTLFPLHDVDKLMMYLFMSWKGTKWVSRKHRKNSSHHPLECTHALTGEVYHTINSDYAYRSLLEMICDWESARFTKPDKPLNARDTCARYYPTLSTLVIPILDRAGL